MVLGEYIAPGTEIEVSDDGEDWIKLFFSHYVPFSIFRIGAFNEIKKSCSYKYYRLIEEKPEQAKQEVYDDQGNVIGYFIPKGGE